MEELARRTHRLPPPPRVLWADLRAPRQEGARVWLVLGAGERWPETLETVEDERVVWSSLWQDRPDDVIALDVRPDGDGSLLEFRWLAAPPAPAHASPYRYRLNQLLAQELRYSYGN